MEYPIFDAHCDTMSELYNKRKNFCRSNLHIDFERMKKYSGYTQIFAAFVDKKIITQSPYEYVQEIIDVYLSETEKNGILRCEKAEQLGTAPYSSILALEGGEAIEGSLEKLEKIYEKGVRVMTLTWNYKNEIADGVTEDTGTGLTTFGKDTVKKMNELGMVVDVSHLSEKSFWDVFDVTEKPFIASHSNAKALCSHQRNLSDDQIKAIIEMGGVIGINFYPLFLSDSEQCSVEKIVDHMEYILEMGGEDNIGLGSDFDGVEYLPYGMTGIESVKTLISLMESRGFGQNIIKKITYENFLRVLKANFA